MQSFAKKFLSFVEASPTPFHVCRNAATMLEEAGFIRLHEDAPWKPLLETGGKYFFTRNGSSIVAFHVGPRYKSGNPFKIIGAHTDSPVLRVKPVSKRLAHGYDQVGVECYGGGLWHTWLDRDLGIAGRVVLYSGKNTFDQRLVHIKSPILRVPSLCIHLQTGKERAALEVNKEKHLQPILGLVSSELNSKPELDSSDTSDKRHSVKLLDILSKELNCSVGDIIDFELSLCDTQVPTLGGISEEFIFAPRLDNQLHCFTSLQSLIDTCKDNVSNEDGIQMISLFDHEEVGSDSNEGAGSPLLRDAIQRLVLCLREKELKSTSTDTVNDTPTENVMIGDEVFKIGLSRSLLISADSAHAIHPNYAHKHEINHRPQMGKGTVIKTNQNQRYSTNAITGFFVRELARQTKISYSGLDSSGENPDKVEVQEFVVPNDSACGSTIGPILAHGVGIRVVDVGIPQLSMHSIREQAAVKDL